MESLHATAESLEATLDGMRVMEEMRRTLRDIRDTHKLDSNWSRGLTATPAVPWPVLPCGRNVVSVATSRPA